MPKVLLLTAAPDKWQAQERAFEKDIISGVHAWQFAFDGWHCPAKECTIPYLNSFDLVIANISFDILPELRILQQSRKNTWVTLIERCATDYLAPNPLVKEILDGSDLVNVINKHSLDYFRALTSAKCEWIGIPYPAEGVRKSTRVGMAPKTDIFLMPLLYTVPQYDGPRHSLASYYAAKGIAPIHAMDRDAASSSEGVTVHKELYTRDYLQFLADHAYVSIGLDHRYTWGRHVMDCAALQIPCVSTLSAYQGTVFFPELTVDNEFCIAEARTLLNRLYDRKEFYRHVAQVPLEKFEPYTHESMKRKLLEALG